MSDTEQQTNALADHFHDVWWLTRVEDMLIWARLEPMEAGSARVFDASGQWLVYDSMDSARAALLDANFMALEGMDEADAALFELTLADLSSPSGKDETHWLAQMTVQM